jgi:hypothetical protein
LLADRPDWEPRGRGGRDDVCPSCSRPLVHASRQPDTQDAAIPCYGRGGSGGGVGV